MSNSLHWIGGEYGLFPSQPSITVRRAGFHEEGRYRGRNRIMHNLFGPQRFRLPRMPRTSARPSEEATVRATDFIAASAMLSRW